MPAPPRRAASIALDSSYTLALDSAKGMQCVRRGVFERLELVCLSGEGGQYGDCAVGTIIKNPENKITVYDCTHRHAQELVVVVSLSLPLFPFVCSAYRHALLTHMCVCKNMCVCV
jgi:hypothetical protein